MEALPGIAEAISKYGDYIRTETLANSLDAFAPKSPEGDLTYIAVEWMDGEEIGISIKR